MHRCSDTKMMPNVPKVRYLIGIKPLVSFLVPYRPPQKKNITPQKKKQGHKYRFEISARNAFWRYFQLHPTQKQNKTTKKLKTKNRFEISARNAFSRYFQLHPTPGRGLTRWVKIGGQILKPPEILQLWSRILRQPRTYSKIGSIILLSFGKI